MYRPSLPEGPISNGNHKFDLHGVEHVIVGKQKQLYCVRPTWHCKPELL